MIVHAGGLQALQNPDTGKLAPGVHRATLSALHDYTAINSHRAALWTAFEVWRGQAARRLEPARLWIGGSFVTSKPDPSDVDVLAWIPTSAPSRGAGIADLMTILSAGRLDENGNVERKLGRLQPIGGQVDGFQDRFTPARNAFWRMQWCYDWDEETGEIIPGTEKGIVEVTA